MTATRAGGVEGVWWSPRSSKPLRPDRVGLGGFDSHTLPPARVADPTARRGARRVVGLAVAAASLVITAGIPLSAQVAGGSRVGIERPEPIDGVVAKIDTTYGPPISPRRAFLSSLVLPGAGQAQLDRPYAGGVFLLIEATALALLHRSAEDLRIARRFAGDSVPMRYQVDAASGNVARDAEGNPVVAEWRQGRYSDPWVRTRQLHREDWIAVLVFNHLFAGADAFVAAQLWDLPEKVSIRQTRFGPAVATTIRFGRAPKR